LENLIVEIKTTNERKSPPWTRISKNGALVYRKSA
jgi:hypothetical protein